LEALAILKPSGESRWRGQPRAAAAEGECRLEGQRVTLRQKDWRAPPGASPHWREPPCFGTASTEGASSAGSQRRRQSLR
jgi:hypothetical protein